LRSARLLAKAGGEPRRIPRPAMSFAAIVIVLVFLAALNALNYAEHGRVD
jgi:hypothetical protein